MSLRQELLDKIEEPELFAWDPDEIEELQLEAAREAFAERMEQIPVLARLARDIAAAAIFLPRSASFSLNSAASAP